MPEGDTIFRTADVLRSTLAGRRVLRAHAEPRPGLLTVPRVERVVGATIVDVEPRGKHLLIGFDNGWTLRTHLRMHGSWHRYAPGERWRRPAHEATLVLETASSVAVLFNAPEAELLRTDALARQPQLAALGPDLLSRSFSTDEAVRRLRARSAVPLGEALLDQRAVAGLGNVYKSELCFLAGLDPWAPVGEVSEAQLGELLGLARRLLAANTRGGARVTTSVVAPRGLRVGGAAGRLWVYARAGRPCRRCGTLIRGRRQGEQARMTYWCPRCQQGVR